MLAALWSAFIGWMAMMIDAIQTIRPTLPDVAPQFAAYYAIPGNEAWGSLHIVLDDGNVGDDSVRFCIEYAQSVSDVEGERLARILLTMSKTQRRKLPYAT